MTFNCLFSAIQSATHLGLCLPKVGIVYQHISTLISLSTLPNGCAPYHSPRCYAKIFLLLLSLVVFSTGTCSLLRFLKNFFLLLANIWFCLYCLLLFSYRLILCAFARIFTLRDSLVLCRSCFFCYFLFLFFIFCFFLEIFWVSLFCAMSDNIDRSALRPLIWFSILVFHYGCSWVLLLHFGVFGVLPNFSAITYAITYCSRCMLLRSGVSSAISS